MKTATITTRNGWALVISGSKEVYVEHAPLDGSERQFVARFKYGKTASNAKHFAVFLVSNFTPAEYFAQRAAGHSPIDVAEGKGYIAPQIAHGAAEGDAVCIRVVARIRAAAQAASA